MSEIIEKAYGKVNLSLDITGRREDGYHLVRMVMQTLDIYDTLTMKEVNTPGIEIELLNAQGNAANSGKLSLGQDNLIYKAAHVLLEKTGRLEQGLYITLDKRIPIAAGMAGGSADCAATLRGVNKLLSLGFSNEDLREIGVTLGADVPYCIEGGTALSEGIGEVLTSLPSLAENFEDVTFLVAKPAVSVSTQQAYGQYDELVEKDAQSICHPDVDKMVEAIKARDLSGVCGSMLNVLQYVTAERNPVIVDIVDTMMDAGAENAMMSGSGPTVFGIFTDKVRAENAAREVARGKLANEIFVVKAI